MKPLAEQCASLLRVPLRILTAWLDQERNDYRTACRIITDMRQRCVAFLKGRLSADEVGWIFPYLRECRQSYRSRLQTGDSVPVETLADASCQEPHGTVSESPEAELLLQMIDRSVKQFATADQHQRFLSYRESGCKASQNQSRSMAVSRATLHESVEKARQLGLSGVPLLIARSADPQGDRLLFSEAFAMMTPYTATVLMGFERIQANQQGWLKQHARALEAGYSRIWSHSNRVLQERLTRHSLDTDSVIHLIHTVCLVQTLIAKQAGEFCAPHFAETWEILQRHGGLECQPLRRLFVNIGSYCGQTDLQVDYFRDAQATPLELSGVIALVRGVLHPGRPVLTRLFLTEPQTLVSSLTAAPDPVIGRRIWGLISRYLNNPRCHDPGSTRKILAWLQSWLQLLRAGLPLHEPESARKAEHSCQQYRRSLCATDDHTRVWSQIMNDFSLLPAG